MAPTFGSNSPFADGNGNIQVSPGNQIPAIPRHRVKLCIDYAVTTSGRSAATRSSSPANIWSATSPINTRSCRSYTVFNLHTSYRRVDNIFDRRYATYGQFFDSSALPNFVNGGADLVICAR
ncbi:TonB-dependent receptor [Bradyrhizobium sp. CSA207]|nr:TonB-dependent receptor [Bradyrhizobium sp. CSA207]